MKRAVLIIVVIPAAVLIWLLLRPSGRRLKFHSQILDENRTLLFHLPPGYEESGLSYPVLYILDAYDRRSTYGPSFYDTAGRINAELRDANPSMIVIGVVNTVRTRDMIPVKTELYEESGGADKFLTCFVEELIPHVDMNFRTTGERVLYGRSDSGLFALYALLKRPGVFSAHIAASPTVGHCPEMVGIMIRRLFRTDPNPAGALYIIYGENDIDLVLDRIPEVVKEFHRLAPETFRFEAQVVPAGGHIPESSLYDGLRYHYSRKEN